MGMEAVETIDLEVFLAVARNESIGAAAQELRFSGPSVSNRIASLERKLGARLFERTARGSFTTPAGDRFRDYATGCLALLSEAHESVMQPTHDVLTVAVPGSLGTTLLGPTLRVLSEAGIPANGRVADTGAIIDQVVDGTADFGLVVNGIVPRTLASHRVARSSVLPIVRPDHPLLHDGDDLGIDDLEQHPLAIYRWHADAEALGHMLGHSRRSSSATTVYVGLPAAIIDLVLYADHVGLVADFALPHVLAAGTVRRLPLRLPTWTVDVDLIYRRNAKHRHAIAALVDGIEQLTVAITVDA